MLRIIILTAKYFILFLTVLIVVGAITATIVTYKAPEFVISVIQETLIREEDEVETVPLKAIGVLGDSQSDEYRADDNRGSNFPSTTLNWVEILANARDINFGEWGVWAEPRRRGYEHNWARTGATAKSLIESGQHIGLAEQVKNGEVNVVIIYIGANDFSPYITHDGYEALYNEQLTDAQIERKINSFVADVTTAIDVIGSAGEVQILLITVPDWGNHIGVKLAFPLPQKRKLVNDVIKKTNAELEKIALEREIPTIDPNKFLVQLSKEPTSSKPLIGGENLEYLYLNNNPYNVFLSDGVHTGTAMNALFANYILETLNPLLSSPIKPLSDEEILILSGIK